MSAFMDALRANLRCPKCLTSNRPGVYTIELERDGQAFCNNCSHSWTESLKGKTT